MVKFAILSLLLGCLPCVPVCQAQSLQVTDDQARTAGQRLWKNECDGTIDGLTSWNAGENFASLGIGHYIWYPTGQRGPFEESFPELITFLVARGVAVPDWARTAKACPWNSRQEFEREHASARMKELRTLLADTVPLQARFSAKRLEAALPKMLAAVPAGQGEAVKQQFYRVAASPNGIYALVDYVNFKGEGVLSTERYQDRGWGLLQVLAGMPADANRGTGTEAIRDFSQSASRVLSERVANSPPERHESKWLPGWKSRVATYVPKP